MNKECDFDQKGHLPTEAALKKRPPEVNEDFSPIINEVFDELEIVLKKRDGSKIFAVLESLGKEVSGEEALASVIPQHVLDHDKATVKFLAILFAKRQCAFDQVTAAISAHFRMALEQIFGSAFPDSSSSDLPEGVSQNLLMLFWLSFVLGARSQQPAKSKRLMASLPDLVKLGEMDRSSPLSKYPKKGSARSKDPALRKWVEKIVFGYKRAANGRYPSKSVLEDLITSQVEHSVDSMAQPLVSWVSGEELKERRLQHREDVPTKGISMKTITDTWLRKIREMG